MSYDYECNLAYGTVKRYRITSVDEIIKALEVAIAAGYTGAVIPKMLKLLKNGARLEIIKEQR